MRGRKSRARARALGSAVPPFLGSPPGSGTSLVLHSSAESLGCGTGLVFTLYSPIQQLLSMVFP